MPRSNSTLRRATIPTLAMAASMQWACGSSDDTSAPPPAPKPWRVVDGTLHAPDGRAVLLRGVNIANAHKTPPYFGFHQARDFLRVKEEWGMNAIRLLLTWAAIEPERGQYDEGYLAALAERLEWAQAAGLWVVLDMHQDVYGEGFGGDGAPRWACDEERYEGFSPSEPWYLNYLDDNVVQCFDAFWRDPDLQERYFGAWRKVARRFATHPSVIGFDLMNEPFWGSTEVTEFESSVLQDFYERGVSAVRSEAPGWVAFLEPCSSRNLGVPTSLNPFPFDNVVYAPHSYDLGAEAGNGFDPAHRNTLISNVARMRQEADALGAALWIGEYGGISGDPGIGEYMDATYQAVAAVLGGSMVWAYDRDANYGLLDAQGNEKAELLDALVRPYPEFVSGEPQAIGFDPGTRTFTFSWQPESAATEPTEISVPRRAYPNGYRASCSGCQLESQATRLLVLGAPAQDQVTLTVTPAG